MDAELRGLVERWRQESELMDCDPDVFACLPKAYREHADELEAALSVAQGQGFVMVPRVPTEAMRVAGFESDAWDELGSRVLEKKGWPYSCRESADCVAEIYAAMLAAAPAQPDGVSK